MTALLELRNITKQFPGVRALDGVDFDLQAGEVHVLLGENGAGKSTLAKIIAGVYERDQGSMRLGGDPVAFRSPRAAREAGVRAIYQEFSLVPGLSVAENIFLGREWRRGLFLDRPSMARRTVEVLESLGVQLDLDLPVAELGVAEKQAVEIAKALVADCRILILDEPTAALTEFETERLFALVRRLKARGVGIIYISHRLGEVHRIGDRATVFKDGKVVGCWPIATVTVPELVRAMVGREVGRQYPRSPVEPGEVALEVRGLTRRPAFADVSLTVRRGEIVGLAGLVGAGRTEVARAIFGADRPERGEIIVHGRPVRPSSPAEAIRHGIALLSEDRGRFGLCGLLPLRENVAHASLSRLFPTGLVRLSKEREVAAGYIDRLKIATPDTEKEPRLLSGGNQQKVVLAKWLLTRASIFLFDEPTRGVDVGAKSEMHRLMDDLAKQGAAVLMISADADEIAGMSDRVYVMQSGRITAEIGRGQVTPESVLNAAVRGETA